MPHVEERPRVDFPMINPYLAPGCKCRFKIALPLAQAVSHGRAALPGPDDRRALHGRARGSPAVRGAAERPPGAGGLAGPPRRALQAAARPPHDEDSGGLSSSFSSSFVPFLHGVAV